MSEHEFLSASNKDNKRRKLSINKYYQEKIEKTQRNTPGLFETSSGKNDNNTLDTIKNQSNMILKDEFFNHFEDIGKELKMRLTENKQTIKNPTVDQNMAALCVFVDLGKAFDTVNRNKLTNLENYTVRGTLLNLFTNYISERLQYVKYFNYYITMKYGVLQGNVIDSLLFIIYVNCLV